MPEWPTHNVGCAIDAVLRLLQFEWWIGIVGKFVPVGRGIFFGLCLCGRELWAELG